jgi:hypothetical protein
MYKFCFMQGMLSEAYTLFSEAFSILQQAWNSVIFYVLMDELLVHI